VAARGRKASAAPEDRRVDRAGADECHPYRAPRELLLQALGQRHDRGLRRRVQRLVLEADVPRDRRHVDDVPASPLEHPGQQRPRQQRRCDEVHAGERLDLLDRHPDERAGPAEPGVVDEHVDRAGFVQQRGDAFARREAGDDPPAAALGRHLGDPVGIPAGDDDPRARLGQGERSRASDPTRATGDQTGRVSDVHGRILARRPRPSFRPPSARRSGRIGAAAGGDVASSADSPALGAFCFQKGERRWRDREAQRPRVGHRCGARIVRRRASPRAARC